MDLGKLLGIKDMLDGCRYGYQVYSWHFRILKFYSSEQKWVAPEIETLIHTNFRVVSRL